MRNRIIFIEMLTIALVLFSLTACRKNALSETKPSNAAENRTIDSGARTAQKNGAPNSQNNVSIQPDDLANASPTAIYQAAFAARQKKDVEALKKLMSKDALEFLTLMGEPENKSVDDLLREQAARPQAANAVTRNEKIGGERAALEYENENGQWKTMDFVRENGVWKITIPREKPAIEPDASKK